MEWHDTFKVIKGQNLQQEYQQGCLSDSMEKSRSLQTSKANRIQHHQTSFATNVIRTPLGGKETSNLKQCYPYTDCYIKTSWEQQIQKPKQIHKKRKSK